MDCMNNNEIEESFENDYDEVYSDGLQLIASSISGYSPTFMSVALGYYYDLNSTEEKKQQIKDLAENYYNFTLKDHEVESIYEFIEGDFNNNERWYAWEALTKHACEIEKTGCDKNSGQNLYKRIVKDHKEV